MLDNQLWNQNMADMDEKEDENDENPKDQDKEEVDLGDRQLEQDNLLD